jgi:hypothetical protein|tara:strand:+ start:336 stop:539 length:204 start_codon:yes stop_codon:yes gene_type:complete
MFITTAQAHGFLGGEAGSHDGPLILLFVAVVAVSLLFAEKKWRRRKQRLQNDTDQATQTESNTPAVE